MPFAGEQCDACVSRCVYVSDNKTDNEWESLTWTLSRVWWGFKPSWVGLVDLCLTISDKVTENRTVVTEHENKNIKCQQKWNVVFSFSVSDLCKLFSKFKNIRCYISSCPLRGAVAPEESEWIWKVCHGKYF